MPDNQPIHMSKPATPRKRGTRNATRPRPLPPDVTARNLAVEKKRRQELNDDFLVFPLDLARLVPSLASARRLSKVLIVNEAKRHLRQRRSLCINVARDMQRLLAENSQLVYEVNAMRSQMGQHNVQPHMAMPPTASIKEIMGVENEPAGVFPAGSWDNWSGRPRKPSSPERKENEAAQPPLNDLSQDRTTRSDDADDPSANPQEPPNAMSQNDSADIFSSLFDIDSMNCVTMDMSAFLTNWPVSVDDEL